MWGIRSWSGLLPGMQRMQKGRPAAVEHASCVLPTTHRLLSVTGAFEASERAVDLDRAKKTGHGDGQPVDRRVGLGLCEGWGLWSLRAKQEARTRTAFADGAEPKLSEEEGGSVMG